MNSLKMGSKSMDDFSFPIISNPFSNLMMAPSSSSSSSLWRVSSRVFHHEEEEQDQERMEVRSMCEEGYSPVMSRRSEINIECVSCLGEEWEVEDRMDYLWEDFNHEEEERESKRVVKEICFVKKQGSYKMGRRTSSSINSSSNRHIRSSSRSSILVMGKLLKGLLSIKKSAQHKIMKSRF